MGVGSFLGDRPGCMTTEFKELLSVSAEDKAQIWIIGTREQVNQLINECYV